jgi:hypothetical protein
VPPSVPTATPKGWGSGGKQICLVTPIFPPADNEVVNPRHGTKIRSPDCAASVRKWHSSLGAASAAECVTFGAERLQLGMGFAHPLPGGLVFRMTTDEDPKLSQWRLQVTPRDKPLHDFLWIVSPRWQTTPHLVIGPAWRA